MLEVLFVSNSENNHTSCSALDYRTGTNLMTYKGGGNLQFNSFNMIRSEYVLGANSMKPLLHVWPINSQEQVATVRFVLPGKANAVALSPDGYYLIAGVQETLYVWNIRTGRMLNAINKHFQPIRCIRFTDDGSHFASGSNDGAILVWNLTQVVTPNDEDNQTPLYSFNDHGLPLTNVYIGSGGMRCYMYTVSLDRSCKIYDLSNGVMLLSLFFAEGLHCVVANAVETCVYVGGGQGGIFEFHIDSPPRSKEYHLEKEISNRFDGHKLGSIVSSLNLSFDGHTLISGGDDGQVCIWYISTKQLLKTLQFKGPITNLRIQMTSLSIFNPENKQPQILNGNLKRMMDSTVFEENETYEVLVSESQEEYKIASQYILHNTNEQYVQQTRSQSNLASIGEIEKLQAEVKYLREVNKALFELSSRRLLQEK